MQITPILTPTRIEKLKPSDLFLIGEGSSFGLALAISSQEPDKLETPSFVMLSSYEELHLGDIVYGSTLYHKKLMKLPESSISYDLTQKNFDMAWHQMDIYGSLIIGNAGVGLVANLNRKTTQVYNVETGDRFSFDRSECRVKKWSLMLRDANNDWREAFKIDAFPLQK